MPGAWTVDGEKVVTYLEAMDKSVKVKVSASADGLPFMWIDQRVLDGATVDWFLRKVKETLESWT